MNFSCWEYQVTSIIIFLGSVINVLYYLGVMQYIIGKIAWFMQQCLHTTAAEVEKNIPKKKGIL
jgi:pyrimidine nucleoside transport protein